MPALALAFTALRLHFAGMSSLSLRMWSWNGGGFVPCEGVPLSDRGFRYGMSLFESLRVVSSQPRHLAAHLARLRESCAAREFQCDERALTAVGELLGGGGIAEGFARIYITAGDGAPTAPVSHGRVFVFLEARERPVESAYDLGISEEIFHPPFGGLKTGNYWANLDALLRAQRSGRHEALLFNERAELVSACMANVFVVRDGVVRTPALACGARAGVVRELVLQRLAVVEGSLFVDDVMRADEIFLTNSWIGVMPAGSLGGRALPSRAVAESLRDLPRV